MSTRLLTFLILGMMTLPAYAERYSSSGEALFVGALQGLFIMLVIWLWKIFKSRKSPSNAPLDNTMTTQSKPLSMPTDASEISAWEQFKITDQDMANTITSLTNEDLTRLFSKDLNEKISTFKRMGKVFNCSLTDLKNTCIKSFTDQFNPEELPLVIDKLSKKANEEASIYAITKDNTMSHYLQVWLKESIA